jgi:Cd2+/Zn2+-exporting ATPase
MSSSRDHERERPPPDGPANDAPGDGDVETARFEVPEMDCASCAGTVEAALDAAEGVADRDAVPATGRVTVTYDSGVASVSDLVDAIDGVGYEVTDTGDTDGRTDDPESVWRSPRAVTTWVGAALLVGGLVSEFMIVGWTPQIGSILGSELHLADALFLGAVAVSGQAILKDGYYSARHRQLDIDVLMSAAIAGALAASLGFGAALYFEAATLAVLFSVAELLERHSMDRARDSLRELLDLSPEDATVKRDGSEETVPVDAVSPDDVVVVRPGGKIPADGEVVAGDSAVNQSPITGESVPVDKTPGDEVYAGTLVENGYLEVRVTAAATDTTLSRIVALVEDAGSERTDREQFVERFSSYYTPAVVAFAVVVSVSAPLVFGVAWPTALVYGLTLLVLACPCAFVIATPVSVVSGITSAAKNGVLIKGGTHLEAMGAVGTVAFDKTGTLTTGELAVTDVIGINGNTEADVLRCARGLEQRSEHPVGKAIVAAADDAGIAGSDVPAVGGFESLTGKGVRGRLDGTPHVAGKPGLFAELDFDLSHVHAVTDGGRVMANESERCERTDCVDLLDGVVHELQSEGKTVVLIGGDDEIEGIIAVADEVRPGAARAVARLKQLGVSRTVMLTGDNERTASAVAEAVGVDEFRAALLPEEKADAVRGLTDGPAGDDGGAAMVGDGINDAPALATATVGIAMGAAGTDTALETADIALLADDLSKLPYLYELAGDANSVIRQNVWTSLGLKALLALAVPFGYVPIWLAVLAGDAGMTVGVTANAMRLSRLRPEVD